MENAENEIPVPTRLSALESGIEKILGLLGSVAPFVSVIPGVGAVVNGMQAVGHVADEILHEFDENDGGAGGVDAAALAAGQIAKSTGNPEADKRIAEIELLLVAAIPVIKAIAKHFAIDTTALEVTPQPMTVA